MGSTFQMNGWHYSRPNTNRNKDGNIVLIKAVSFGPAEVHEWGIHASGQPYRLDDWIDEDASRETTITKGEIAGELRSLISRCQAEGRQDWVAACENALLWLDNH